ncbi:MAG: hypothetical protein KDA22_12370, partial [Phycisphaerales bacterium]|nr:hypothetical protein [Phycisphaerales bacterium]
WDLGGDHTPEKKNPGLSLPASLEIAELRNAQQGADLDEYVEIAGQPGTSLDNVWFIVIGDEVQTGVPDSQGRVQTAVDLTGHTLDENGLFLIGRGSLSLATPDLVNLLNFKEIGNVTYALVTGFTGYPGLDLDIFDNGNIDITVWSSVLDAIALRRNGNPQGVYLGAPTLGPVASKTQTYGVGWQLADRWMTYQASNFVTPPFPGYVSGHSTFSRSGAEALTGITGSPYFPGGLFNYTIPADWLKFEFGPSTPVTFQWVTYYDASDEAGESRIWGGIHPPVDDIPGRIAGDEVGKRVVERVKALYSGEYLSPDINGDGVVDGADLGLLLGQWGSNGGFGDLNGDGLVDGADLGLLLGDWG